MVAILYIIYETHPALAELTGTPGEHVLKTIKQKYLVAIAILSLNIFPLAWWQVLSGKDKYK